MRIVNATVVDIARGQLISNACIVSEHGRIAGVRRQDGPEVANTDDAIDASGLYVMPGLIDCHTHLVWDGSADPTTVMLGMDDETNAIAMAKHVEATLRLGITTVRDLASPHRVGFAVREAVRRGIVAGPNMVISGPNICMTGGHGWHMGLEADGVDEVRKATRQLLKQGVDVIKVMASGGVYTDGEEPGSVQYSVEELSVAVEEAHKKNVRVSAHAEGITGIRSALKAGVDTIEHANLADEAAWDDFLRQGTWLIPTLVTFRNLARPGTGIPEFAIRKAQQIQAAHSVNFRRAVEKGVKIAVGTDCNSPLLPHARYFDELKVMHELGMSKLAVLQAATINAAQAIARDDVGSIAPGKRADLLLLSVNPLEDLDIGGKIVKIIKDGTVIR